MPLSPRMSSLAETSCHSTATSTSRPFSTRSRVPMGRG
jgi:hypothetical protein